MLLTQYICSICHSLAYFYVVWTNISACLRHIYWTAFQLRLRVRFQFISFPLQLQGNGAKNVKRYEHVSENWMYCVRFAAIDRITSQLMWFYETSDTYRFIIRTIRSTTHSTLRLTDAQTASFDIFNLYSQ